VADLALQGMLATAASNGSGELATSSERIKEDTLRFFLERAEKELEAVERKRSAMMSKATAIAALAAALMAIVAAPALDSTSLATHSSWLALLVAIGHSLSR
jgi:hypothetical protein